MGKTSWSSLPLWLLSLASLLASVSLLAGEASLSPGTVLEGRGGAKYRIESPIARGSYGDVYRVIKTDASGRQSLLSLKVFRNLDHDVDLSFYAHLVVQRLQKLDPERCSRLLSVHSVDTMRDGSGSTLQQFIAAELGVADLADLTSSLLTFRSITPENKAQFFENIAVQMLEGLEQLHSGRAPLVHGDIKPENLIFVRQGQALNQVQDNSHQALLEEYLAGTVQLKIADFDTVEYQGRQLDPDIDNRRGTAAFIAPESLLRSDLFYSKEQDYFSLGVTLYGIIMRETNPYESFFDAEPEFSSAIELSEPKWSRNAGNKFYLGMYKALEANPRALARFPEWINKHIDEQIKRLSTDDKGKESKELRNRYQTLKTLILKLIQFDPKQRKI